MRGNFADYVALQQVCRANLRNETKQKINHLLDKRIPSIRRIAYSDNYDKLKDLLELSPKTSFIATFDNVSVCDFWAAACKMFTH